MTQQAADAVRARDSAEPQPLREPLWRPALRVLLGLAVSLLVSLLWWAHTPRTLQRPVDIVGYPAFNNWAYAPSFTAYRLTVYAFPIGAIVLYALLAWRGPLARPAASRPRTRYEGNADGEELDEQPRPEAGALLSAAVRLLLPAAVVAIEASTRGYGRRLNGNGAVAAVLYVGAVLGVACFAWRGGTAGRRRVGPLRADRVASANQYIAAVNALLAPPAVLLGLWYVSRHTGVRVGHHVQRWTWLPIWLAVLGAALAVVWSVRQLHRGWSSTRVERLIVTVVVGSVFVFLATVRLPGGLAQFVGGFDDSQSITGATLLRAGLFPWRDMLFIHGLFPDVLAGNLGQAVFGDTVWGQAAGTAALLVPASWVVVYLFAVWVTRRNGWLLATAAIFIATGGLGPIETRFLLVPAVLLVLARTLARFSAGWCVGLMTLLFALEILVPETLFLALPTAAVIVVADYVGRDPAARLRAAFRRSYWFFGTGAVLAAVWAAYLIANRALGAFVDYYVVFGPGHDAAGAHGPQSDVGARTWLEFGLVIAAVLFTYGRMAWHVHLHAAWTPRHWVTIAAAGFAALYGEKALGRFDLPHVGQTFTAALPLLFLSAEAVVGGLDGGLRAMFRRPARGHRRPTRVGLRHPVAFACLTVAVVIVPAVLPGRSIFTQAEHIPANEHAVSAQVSPVAHIGYAQPDAVDIALLDDLRALLDTYAGPAGRIFDMSNSLGYFYYLLGRLPATKFIHVSMAIPVSAQNMLIDELKASRPSVVVFDSTTIGVPHWDLIANDIRHYEISRYVLRGWTPMVRVGGVLLMLRNDLMAGRKPLPPLKNPPETKNLYASGRPCDWGDVANFLPTYSSGASITVPVRALGERTALTVEGWAADPAKRAPAPLVVLVRDGRVVGSGVPSRLRADVAQRFGYGGSSGFHITSLDAGSGPVAVLAMMSDGRLHPLRNEPVGAVIPRSVRLPDGRRVKVTRPTRGRVAGTVLTRSAVGLATLPAGTHIPDYDVVTLRASHDLGPSQISLADAAMLDDGGQIQAAVLPVAGSSFSVRASSCLQWPGFTDRHLYVLQTGGAMPTQLELSAVR